MAFAGRSNKIFKEGGAKPDAFEEQVASAIFDLQVQTDMKADLQDLFITSASQVEVGSRQAIIIHVPFRLLNQFHRIQQRLIRELEKKFSGKHVTIIAQRRILPREVCLTLAPAPPACESRIFCRAPPALARLLEQQHSAAMMVELRAQTFFLYVLCGGLDTGPQEPHQQAEATLLPHPQLGARLDARGPGVSHRDRWQAYARSRGRL
jgi:hypothetical protein